MSPKPRKKPLNPENGEDPEQRIPFHFHGEAHAFSDRFHRPFHFPIEAQASVSLPTIGGHARSRVENFTGDHLGPFTAAHCHFSGSWLNNGVSTTHATSTTAGPTLLNFLTPDPFAARLPSAHHLTTP